MCGVETAILDPSALLAGSVWRRLPVASTQERPARSAFAALGSRRLIDGEFRSNQEVTDARKHSETKRQPQDISGKQASRGQVLSQFLVEAIMLSILHE
jgi:hypothetical protein